MALIRLLGVLTGVLHAILALVVGAFAMRGALGLVHVPAGRRLSTGLMMLPMLVLPLAAAIGLLAIASAAARDPLRARRALIRADAPLLVLGLLLVAYGRMAQDAAARSAASGGGLMGGFGDVLLMAGLGLTLAAGTGLACAWASARRRADHQSVGL